MAEIKTNEHIVTSREGNKVHIASVHDRTKEFKCDVCDYCGSQKAHLDRHISSIHEGKKEFKCNICDYCSSQKINLKRHLASVQL